MFQVIYRAYEEILFTKISQIEKILCKRKIAKYYGFIHIACSSTSELVIQSMEPESSNFQPNTPIPDPNTIPEPTKISKPTIIPELIETLRQLQKKIVSIVQS